MIVMVGRTNTIELTCTTDLLADQNVSSACMNIGMTNTFAGSMIHKPCSPRHSPDDVITGIEAATADPI